MRQSFSIIFILTLFISCKGQDTFIKDRLVTANEFVACITNNTPDKILGYTFHSDMDDNITNKESRDFNINKAHKFVKKFGLPAQDKWIIKYDPQNNFERLVIIIPIFKGYDSVFNLLKADIVLTFPPPQISDKIYRYKIADEYKMKPLIAPPVTDTTRRKK